ncbi:N-acetylglucosamine-6-phosphate deacetylase [Anaerosporomusa subterranea]|uniref:N-acetylglucosamine-6-phosphate deacetylase n=1 Tax=Anaerosporomusa subterranea TaxID=1794912 RepID=A0A154BR88_ANASB|nr:N-acetylglucosamine-6-phosphate deacetylase [Anaerosporomusa subterranea]KYZ76441.1 N-acetylglucosamine-6-phosphate deacetylase [Anaerosporomusa subterranea]
MNNGRITHAKVVLSDQVLDDETVIIRGGRIVAVGSAPATDGCDAWTVDAAGDWIVPGLIDLHVHGAGGCDTMDGTPESLTAMSRTLLSQGTTAFLTTTMSSSPDTLATVLTNIAAVQKAQTDGAEILGVHMEGPFLSPAYKGAQTEEALYPAERADEAAVFAALAERYPGLVRILTLAIERPGAAELVRLCRQFGIIPSVGHSEATYEQMRQAVEWGVSQVTHAFNAMPSIHHRRPGLLTEALKNPAIRLELIADGVHIHPAILELVLGIKPEPSVLLVSDGTRAVGMPDGEYDLGGQMTYVKNGIATLSDGTIAGSAFPLLQGVKTLAKIGYDLPRAIRHASLYPAQLLGIEDHLGSIAPGKEATLVRLDFALNIKQVWQRGMLVSWR